MFRFTELFTVAEIAKATGRTECAVSARIISHRAAGDLPERPRGKRGAPAMYTYEEVKIILRPVHGGEEPREPDAPEVSRARIAALRHQLQTDGFTVR